MLALSRFWTPLSAAAVAFAAAACSGGSTPTDPDLPPALSVVDLDGIRYTATSAFTDTTSRQVLVTVTARNQTSDPIEIEWGPISSAARRAGTTTSRRRSG